jgi:hypothetical protein
MQAENIYMSSPQVRNMTKEYTTRSGRPFLAANNVSLDVPANSITALLGPSGSGGPSAWGADPMQLHHMVPVHIHSIERPACHMQHANDPTSCDIVMHRQDDPAAAYSGAGGDYGWQRDVWRCGLEIMLPWVADTHLLSPASACTAAAGTCCKRTLPALQTRT